jgi:flagellar hook-associated protein 2
MASINFNGIGSGIDFNSVRDAIINQRQQPINQLQSKVFNYNTRADSLRKLNGLLATFTTATKDLTVRTVGTGRTATLVDASIATVTASSTANLGSLNLNVTRLATNLTQTSKSYTSSTNPFLAGGATNATFELRLGGAATGTAITIDSTNNSLAGLRDVINGANAGVTASIVDLTGDGTQQQIVLSSKASGASGRVELVETTATGTGADLTLRSLNPPDGDFSKLDAAFSINGLDLTRSTNNITNAVSGLNLTLKKTGSTVIDVGESSEIEDKLTALVTAYNAVQDFFAEQYKKDGTGRPTGALSSDSSLRNAQQQLSSITRIASETNGGTLKSLTQVGVAPNKEGKLELDKTILKEQITADPANVRALLYGKTTSDEGIFQSAYQVSNGLSDNIIGSIQTAINGYTASVKTINSTITSRTAILEQLRESLSRQFAAADTAIGQLNSQNSALTNVIKSLSSSSSS